MEINTYQSIENLNTNISVLVNTASSLDVNNQQAMSDSSDTMKLLKGLLKKVDEQEKSFTKPINDHLKKLRLQFKPLKETINLTIEGLKVKQTVFLTEQRRMEQEEAHKRQKEFEERALKQAEEMQAAGLDKAAEQLVDAAAEIEAPKVKAKSTGNYSTTSIRRSISYEVVDLEKVPTPLLMINDKAVKELLADLRDKLKAEALAKGYSEEKASDYVYHNLSSGDIAGLNIIINETVVTR